jgi:cation transport ATPase
MNNAVAIRSAIPGRERWQIGPLRSEPSYAVAIERELSRHAPVRYAWANPLTGRLLLQYDPGVQPEEVRDRLYASLDATPANDDEVNEWRTTWPHGFNRSLDEVAVEQARLRLIMSAGLFTGVLAKRVILGSGMFAGSPVWVQASAIMTIITGYSALRRGVDTVIAAGGFSSTTLLHSITLGLLVAVESLDGIGAHVVANAGDLYEKKFIRNSRNLIRSSGFEVLPSAQLPRDRFEAVSTAALIASLGTYVVTRDAQRSTAMLLGAVPVASTESRVTARALALGHALERGILFRDPQVLSSHEIPTFAVIGRSSTDEINAADVLLIDDDSERRDYANALIARTSRIVGQDEWVSRLVGIVGFAAAAAGKLTASQASRLHNSTRLAMELNSLRLVSASQ